MKYIHIFAMLVMSLLVSPPSQASLRFEAEEWTTPRDGWQVNRYSENRWNLWSQDRDAETKWSGGIVLQSPPILVDRNTGDEGAPVLHTVIEGIPPGMYNVELGPTGRVLAISFDGTTWQRATQGTLLRNHPIGPEGSFELWVDDRYAMDQEKHRGAAYYDYIEFVPSEADQLQKLLGPGVRVEGNTLIRREEKLDRGLVALRTPKGVYLSWRLLADDSWDQGFDVYRVEPSGAAQKLSKEPIRQTTDFFDVTPPAGNVTYRVLDTEAKASADALATPYISIKLQDPTATINRVAIIDLNGDGRLDYIIKTPKDNIDPGRYYWEPSPDTYVVEGYLHDGTFLWRHDLGWAIERGIWYSPFVAWDLDGDGKAEWAAKIGEGDDRDQDGRVSSGPEWLAVFNGITGEELARIPWPDREGFGENNYVLSSRNQIAIAFLDGKTPNILAIRGTYGRMKVAAYEFHQGALRQVWNYDNEKLPRRYWGQGAHTTYCFDADGDGRDEVLLGSIMLDDTGIPLWSTGLGHPDLLYVGDHDPLRPGLELFYGIETPARRDGMCMVDPFSGRILWGFNEPTNHVHGRGFCADVDPLATGNECFALESLSKEPVLSKGPWLWSASGELLTFEDPFLPKEYGPHTIHWDNDLQREIFYKGQISNYRGQTLVKGIQGSFVAIADVLGDWREELLTSVPGELRIYSTTLPAHDRRVCLLQDRIYRSRTVLNTSGYHMGPNLSYHLENFWPNLNVSLDNSSAGQLFGQVVVSAPLTGSLHGTLAIHGPDESTPQKKWAINLFPGTRSHFSFPAESDPPTPNSMLVQFTGQINYGKDSIPEGTPVPPELDQFPVGFTRNIELSTTVHR
jgi:rhamnogalacturonan endolyase